MRLTGEFKYLDPATGEWVTLGVKTIVFDPPINSQISPTPISADDVLAVGNMSMATFKLDQSFSRTLVESLKGLAEHLAPASSAPRYPGAGDPYSKNYPRKYRK